MTKKLLVADDEQFISTAYSDGLQRAGFTVLVTHDGAEALEKIKSERPDLVLLDLIMPKMDGFEVLKKVKADPQVKATPIVILTNLSQETDVDEVKKLGAVDFVVKSDISLQDLIAKVSNLLS